jgi:hypothetical protein
VGNRIPEMKEQRMKTMKVVGMEIATMEMKKSNFSIVI